MRLERGVARLRAMGWEIAVGESCRAGAGIWAGTDEERAGELHQLLCDRSIGAIFAGRGGVGALRLLPYLDSLPDRLPPVWLVGRSDITALHLRFWGRYAWVGVSGPMVATDLGGVEDPPEPVMEETRRLLCGTTPIGSIAADQLEAWIPGEARGPLLPVNLSLLVSMVGTGYLPSLAGTILVLEEIDETPQRIDRMLTQLRLSGALGGVAGLVFGQFTDCRPRGETLPASVVRDVLLDHAKRIGVPAVAGLAYGHEPSFHPLPVGAIARLSATDAPGLEVIEAAGSPAPA